MNEMDACDESMVDALVTMAEWQETSRVVEEAGSVFALGRSRFPTPYSNAVFPAAAALPGKLADRAAELFADRRYFLWARGKDGEAVGEFAREHGFVLFGDLPAMVIESRVPSPERGVEVTRVRDAGGFADFVRVSKVAYAEAGLPEKVADSLLARPEAAMNSCVVAVARLDGRPAAAAVAITNAVTGIGGVYWVGTVPEARRRGAADAVTRFVTNASFDDGATIVTLQASAAGEPVYLRMGYREVGRYARFLSPAPSGRQHA